MKGIYIPGGYPDRETFRQYLKDIEKAGFNFVEIGIPFSEPVADGPVIASVLGTLIDMGLSLNELKEDIQWAKEHTSLKIIPMTYSNIVYSGGVRQFSDMLSPYVDGIIIADCPNRMHSFFYNQGLQIPIISFITPETRPEDLKLLKKARGDFIYCIGIRGITGESMNQESDDLRSLIQKASDISGKKIILGFGIKTREDADRVSAISDGFVIGTAAVSVQNSVEKYRNFLSIFFNCKII